MAMGYSISRRVAKHQLATKLYKIEKNGVVNLPDRCAWKVSPTVQKTVELNLNDTPKGSKYPCFAPVMSRLTLNEALQLSEQLRKAVKASKECPLAEKRRLEKTMKDITKKSSNKSIQRT